jgi:hypothetical protein
MYAWKMYQPYLLVNVNFIVSSFQIPAGYTWKYIGFDELQYYGEKIGTYLRNQQRRIVSQDKIWKGNFFLKQRYGVFGRDPSHIHFLIVVVKAI